jgi:hypothetical protein
MASKHITENELKELAFFIKTNKIKQSAIACKIGYTVQRLNVILRSVVKEKQERLSVSLANDIKKAVEEILTSKINEIIITKKQEQKTLVELEKEQEQVKNALHDFRSYYSYASGA